MHHFCLEIRGLSKVGISAILSTACALQLREDLKMQATKLRIAGRFKCRLLRKYVVTNKG